MLYQVIKYGGKPTHPLFYAIWGFAVLGGALLILIFVLVTHPAWASSSPLLTTAARRIPWFLKTSERHDRIVASGGGSSNSKSSSSSFSWSSSTLQKPPLVPFRLTGREAQLHKLPWLPDVRQATSGIENVTMPDGSVRQVPWHVLSYTNPRALILNHTVTAAEAEEIIRAASPELKRSEVIAGTHGENAVNSIRSSTGMFLVQPDQINLPANRALRASVKHFGGVLDDSWIEATQVLRYDGSARQRYVPHADYYSSDDSANLARGGQRIYTVLTWLSRVSGGGETRFPNAHAGPGGLAVPPQYLNSILFYDCAPDMTPDPFSVHGGDPPAPGQIKYVAVQWVHGKTFV